MSYVQEADEKNRSASDVEETSQMSRDWLGVSLPIRRLLALLLLIIAWRLIIPLFDGYFSGPSNETSIRKVRHTEVGKTSDRRPQIQLPPGIVVPLLLGYPGRVKGTARESRLCLRAIIIRAQHYFIRE
jgi:hypothetical protein